jgi:hypothetical protein
MIYILIYLIGYITVYILIMKDFKSDSNYKIDSSDISFCLGISLFSWLYIIGLLLKLIVDSFINWQLNYWNK